MKEGQTFLASDLTFQYIFGVFTEKFQYIFGSFVLKIKTARQDISACLQLQILKTVCIIPFWVKVFVPTSMLR